MRIRHRSVAVLGAPIGAWALFGCLSLAGLSAETCSSLALAWGGGWIAVSWLGGRRGGVAGSMRSGAIVMSMLVPVPVYLLTEAAEWLQLMPSSVGLPMFATLFCSAPVLLWIISLRSRRPRNNGPLMVVPWTHYDPHVPAGSIPPRTSTMRAVSRVV